MIKTASCIVIDRSESSASIEEELAMVAKLADHSQVVILADQRTDHTADQNSAKHPTPVLTYRPTYRNAVLGIVLKGLVIVFMGFTLIPMMEKYLGRQVSAGVVGSIVFFAFLIAAIVFVFRRSIPRKTRKQIRQAMSSALA